MCGIAGLVGLEPRDRVPRMREMRARLVHRGPDSEGEFADTHASLGVRRLRIIDLVSGDQPQSNEDGSIWVVFNGEIYNFRELRRELAASGHALRTRSDTEVIVHLYEDLGERLVERLEGMFAFALWDARRKTLLLARDRIGKKPLLYCEEDGELLFASEHAALLAGSHARPVVARDAIHTYLRLGYVPAPQDAFVGVRKLPPAHTLTWRDGQSTLRRYWEPPQPGSLRLDEAEAARELRRLMELAVERRLVADVPLGAFLSGGVDSSVVVATMASLRSEVRTFTIGFEEAGYSEVIHARRIASRYGTRHHEFVVRPDALEILPTLVRHYGEPFADSSAIPTYYLSRLTRQHVTVALSGDGGDELFAGYDRYRAMRLGSQIDRLPGPLRRSTLALGEVLVGAAASERSARGRARRLLRGLRLPPRERYLGWLGLFDASELSGLLSPDFATEAAVFDVMPLRDGFGGPDPVAAAQRLDLALYLPDDLLVKTDIASMANSLEVRCPFLDRELVEFGMALPTQLKLRAGRGKYILRRTFADRVPVENTERPKRGFAVPLEKWFRSSLRDYASDVLLSSRAAARGYFQPERVAAMLQEHVSGRADHARGLWALLVLEIWHRELVDR